MMQKLLLGSVLLGTLVSCAPRTDTANAMLGVTQRPVLVKLLQSAVRGQDVTVQGRYLGGISGAHLRLGADADGHGGYLIPDSAIKTWNDTSIVFTVPSNAPVGASWLFAEVGGVQSTGLPLSVTQ